MQQVPEGLGRDHLHLDFQASPASVRETLGRMLSVPPLSRLSDEGRSTAELVLAEVLNNVAEHAYGAGAGPVAVTLRQEPQGVRCLIVDQGTAMPGGKLPEGRLPKAARHALEELPEGGFGWYLVRSLTVGLSYSRAEGCNRLCFTLPRAD